MVSCLHVGAHALGPFWLVRLLALLGLLHPDKSTTKSCSYPIAAVSGLALEELNSDTLPAEPGAAATDPDLEANLTLNVQRPQRSHDPHGPHQRAEASPQA